MADYWGAEIAYTGNPYGGNRYHNDWSTGDFEPTPAAGADNPNTIEIIRQQLMNQHPEDISALADQWQNAYNLLNSIRDQLIDQSNRLYDEAWKSSAAKDLFMERGPGKTLVYLDEWIEAAASNRDALRGLVTVASTARDDMDRLWSEYKTAVEDAQSLEDASPNTKSYPVMADSHIESNLDEVEQEYNRRAQELAIRVATEYFDYLSYKGYGPPFRPMDAVLNDPGNGIWSGMPPGGAPGAPPGAGGMPGAPPGAGGAPAAPGAGGMPTAPPGGAGAPPAAPPGTAAPAGAGAAGMPGAPPPVPGAMPLVAAARMAARQNLLAPPPGSVGGPGAAAGPAAGAPVPRPPGVAPGAGGPSGATTPAALRNGVLQRPGLAPPPGAGGGAGMAAPPAGSGAGPVPPPGAARPPAGALPPGAARPPGAAPPVFGRPQQQSPTAPAQPAGPQQVRPTGPFSGTPGTTAPPVLGNRQTPGQPRPGSRDELTPRRTGSTTGNSTPVARGTSPPVLDASRRSVPGAGRSDADLRPAAGRTDRDRQRPGTEWVGAEQARSGASTPVLGGSAPAGDTAPRLVEVPTELRRSTEPVTTGHRDEPASPEFTTRRTERDVVQPDGTADGGEEQRIVTDEQAFNVETPGGGVLAHQRDTAYYRPEPPAALGGR